MSAPPHDGWPAEGSIWEHWSDLLLATQLAALREGYTGISKAWHPRNSEKVGIRCKIENSDNREGSCQQQLVFARARDPANLGGAWVVEKLRLENLAVGRHTKHTGGVGISNGFKVRSVYLVMSLLSLSNEAASISTQTSPKKRPKLTIGHIVEDWKSMHRLEGAFRASARLDGRFLHTKGRPAKHGSTSQLFSYYFSCVIGEKCDFYARFNPQKQADGEGWICEQLCTRHTCTSIAPEITKSLAQILTFWVCSPFRPNLFLKVPSDVS